MTITYGTLWNRSARRLGKELTEDEARLRHEAREKYAAVIEGDDGSTVVVEVSGRPPVVGVFFLDEERHDAAEYVFVAHPDGTDLWLEQTFVRTVVDRRTITGQEWTVTRPDGRLYAERFTPEDPARRSVEDTFDPAQFPELREPFPAFGEYASLTRWERGRPS